ncbi:DinB family protein [Nocardia asteroides]|uniref:DinB family protein n=1 Tax=Nocardia asteroides TaxID=1824 RepID=UPI001E62EAD7|nr:DinB family protein [Nocardia asteroides]UGT61494.1 DinB family protein [Nocardia asteroides]
MTWTAPAVERDPVPPTGTEAAQLRARLARQRATLLDRCAGLDGEQLARRAVPPSTLSLLGLIRHLSEVERGWLRTTAAGERLGYLYCATDNPDGDFDDADPANAATDFATYHRETTAADLAVEHLALDHDGHHPITGEPYSLRWIYLHLLEEYARHNGHADLLRQCVDGRTGS